MFKAIADVLETRNILQRNVPLIELVVGWQEKQCTKQSHPAAK